MPISTAVRARWPGRCTLGLKRGDRVATLMWNHYAHLEAYFAIPCSGAVVHTLNLRLHPTISAIANHAADRFLIVDDVLLRSTTSFARARNSRKS
jgi:acyl-CoA synthetase (AMP-forming)/AMP-acid ligase II